MSAYQGDAEKENEKKNRETEPYKTENCGASKKKHNKTKPTTPNCLIKLCTLSDIVRAPPVKLHSSRHQDGKMSTLVRAANICFRC